MKSHFLESRCAVHAERCCRARPPGRNRAVRSRIWPGMPRYFFHLHNDIEVCDEEGVDLADAAAARALAVREARSIAAEQVAHGRLVLSHSIEVTDAAGATVCTMRFGDVIEIAQ